MKRMYSELNEIYDQIEAAIQKDPILNANGDFKTLMQDEEFLRLYHMREMGMSDWTTSINTAIERGIEKGAMQKQIEIAKNLLGEGLSVQLIQKTTGLDIETIQQCQTSKIDD
jgi:predicted transposase/invertase (TIGR01784 family)